MPRGVSARASMRITFLLLSLTYAVLYTLSGSWSGMSASVSTHSMLLSVGLVAASTVDLHELRIPNSLGLGLAGAGLCAAALLPSMPLSHHVLAVALGASLLGTAIVLYRKLRGTDGMGWGDAKLYAAAGAWVGTAGLLSVLLFACFTAMLHVAGAAMLGKSLSSQTRIPFGPHLAFGTWVVWLFGPVI